MAISKIVYKDSPSATGETWMDLTQDSVTASTLLSGETATQANGVRTVGTMSAGSMPYGDAELIARYVVQENSTSVNVNTDINGEPFALANAMVIVKFGTPTTSTQDYVLSNFYSVENYYMGLPTLRLVSGGSTDTWFFYGFFSFNGLPLTVGKVTTTGNTANAQWATTTSTPTGGNTVLLTTKAIKSFTLSRYNSNTTLIPQGCEIIIYGNRLIETN